MISNDDMRNVTKAIDKQANLSFGFTGERRKLFGEFTRDDLGGINSAAIEAF
jgi:hypothetical protein